jgi:hypothetical protein
MYLHLGFSYVMMYCHTVPYTVPRVVSLVVGCVSDKMNAGRHVDNNIDFDGD